MQVQTLHYFCEIARAGSFYAAAKNLFISQQGLNKAITQLESELGVTLLERSRRGVRLTRSGEIVLARAERIVAEYDQLADELVEDRRATLPDEDRIRVRVSYYSAQIASANANYVQLLSSHSSYIEEPFDKLVQHAAASDGSDLVFLDVHPYSLDGLLKSAEVVFEPIIRTRVGFICKDDSRFAGQTYLHRNSIANAPAAINTHREMARYVDWLFQDTPLQDIRLGVDSPRMLIEYVHTSSADTIAFFDSFGFFLAQRDDDMPTDGLRFIPLSTPLSICHVGFLYAKRALPTLRARYTVGTLKRFLDQNCADYFKEYPLNQ